MHRLTESGIHVSSWTGSGFELKFNWDLLDCRVVTKLDRGAWLGV